MDINKLSTSVFLQYAMGLNKMDMYKKLLSVLVFFSLLSTLCSAQQVQTKDTAALNRRIKEQAKMMGNALQRKDFQSYSKFTYPTIVEKMGGRQNLLNTIEKGARDMEAEGNSFKSVSFGNPSSIIKQNNQLQTTIPQYIEMKVPKGRVISKSTLIALSDDNGKNWYFLDTNGKDLNTLKQYLPELSDQLVIPKKEEPKFYDK